ncbi:hypothetical protein BGW36DRAFT_429656 [Talaromyces proteolyticus]|uniref:RING-type domain-containing protein n=1 Tax=Talaromyces proteolyticus TaxID=1131652 RepID=A0AAD4KKI4_9EURO|nr:uncharacterized protein BGW36DRAFT_429656 [Talaromyces proteolyticus]KAH8693613.1 hypothetical protein BGW36DRAFT_429656 [Talaromyces proteolyticus]
MPPSAEPRTTRARSVAADTSGLLETLQGHVEDIRALLQCGICVRPLYEPYTLACGHTFCYGCLSSWFGSGRSHKTCPDCRAQVKTQPAPAYLVRTIVQMFTGRAELLDKGETTAEHSQNQQEEAQKLEKDKSNENPQTGGLFQGCFNPKAFPNGPIVDVEDGVMRCPNCSWELEEGSCQNCGYYVDDSVTTDSDFTDSTDYNEDMEDMEDIDDDDFGYYDDEWPEGHVFEPMPYPNQVFYGVQPFFPHHHHHIISHHHHHLHPLRAEWTSPTATRDTDDEDHTGSEDEDEDMDSFIDDDEIDGDNESEVDSGTDHSTVVGDQTWPTQHTREGSAGDFPTPALNAEFQDFSSISGESRDLDDHSGEEDDYGDEDDDDDDEEEEPIRPVPRRRLQSPYNPPGLASSLFAGNGIRGQTLGRRSRSGPRDGAAGTSASNAINVEDDSEDEMPVPATRRARLNRN